MSTATERLAHLIAGLATIPQGVGALIDHVVSRLRDMAHNESPTEAQVLALCDELEAQKTAITAAILNGTAAVDEALDEHAAAQPAASDFPSGEEIDAMAFDDLFNLAEKRGLIPEDADPADYTPEQLRDLVAGVPDGTGDAVEDPAPAPVEGSPGADTLSGDAGTGDEAEGLEGSEAEDAAASGDDGLDSQDGGAG